MLAPSTSGRSGLWGEHRATLAGPREVDPGGAKNLSSAEAELCLFLGRVRTSDPAGQDDMLA